MILYSTMKVDVSSLGRMVGRKKYASRIIHETDCTGLVAMAPPAPDRETPRHLAVRPWIVQSSSGSACRTYLFA